MSFSRDSFAAIAAVLLAASTLASAARTDSSNKPPQPPPTSTISGVVSLAGSEAPLVGATVVAYHLATAQLFRSQPTGADGKFTVPNVTFGYYDLAVETADGVFVGDQVVNAPPNGNAVARLKLTPNGAQGNTTREFPGVEGESAGLAQVLKDKKRKGTAWIYTAGAAGGAALLLAGSSDSGGGDGDSSSSQSQPPPE